jgi:predicted O-methyltransferase YrrM
MPDKYLARIQDSLGAALDFPGVAQLRAFPDSPWRVPVVNTRRPRGPMQSESEMLVLMWALTLMLKPKLAIETGADSGVMTRALGAACQANGFGRVLSAEVEPSLAKAARKLCAGLPVEIHCGPALDLPIEEADLLFLDSSYASRLAELGRVRPGAVAVVHDTARELEFGQKVRSLCARHIEGVTPRGFTIIQK